MLLKNKEERERKRKERQREREEREREAQERFRQRWGQVEKGASKKTVRDLVGKPNAVMSGAQYIQRFRVGFVGPRGAFDRIPRLEHWVYVLGDDLSDHYLVVFDERGDVENTQRRF